MSRVSTLLLDTVVDIPTMSIFRENSYIDFETCVQGKLNCLYKLRPILIKLNNDVFF